MVRAHLAGDLCVMDVPLPVNEFVLDLAHVAS